MADQPAWHIDADRSPRLTPAATLLELDGEGWEERSLIRPDGMVVRFLERPIPGREDVGGVQRRYLTNVDRYSQPTDGIELRRG